MTTSRTYGKSIRLRAMQQVFIQDPPITSPAALVLLAKQYLSLDRSIYTHFRMTHVRNAWMREQLKTNKDAKGGLTCAICGRIGLNPFAEHKKRQATLDHILELSKGGKWNDPNNFQVACHQCNGLKSNDPKGKRNQKKKRA